MKMRAHKLTPSALAIAAALVVACGEDIGNRPGGGGSDGGSDGNGGDGASVSDGGGGADTGTVCVLDESNLDQCTLQ